MGRCPVGGCLIGHLVDRCLEDQGVTSPTPWPFLSPGETPRQSQGGWGHLVKTETKVPCQPKGCMLQSKSSYWKIRRITFLPRTRVCGLRFTPALFTLTHGAGRWPVLMTAPLLQAQLPVPCASFSGFPPLL